MPTLSNKPMKQSQNTGRRSVYTPTDTRHTHREYRYNWWTAGGGGLAWRRQRRGGIRIPYDPRILPLSLPLSVLLLLYCFLRPFRRLRPLCRPPRHRETLVLLCEPVLTCRQDHSSTLTITVYTTVLTIDSLLLCLMVVGLWILNHL